MQVKLKVDSNLIEFSSRHLQIVINRLVLGLLLGFVAVVQSPNGFAANHAPRVINITQITGKKIVGPVTAWQTRNGKFNVEHLAARSLDNDLLVFYWQRNGKNWQVVNVSQITGRKIAGPITSWQTKNGQFNVEHLAVRGPHNELLNFYWQPDGKDWRMVDVSRKTGRKILGPLTSWQTRNGKYNVEHIAGRGLNNELLVFYWQPNGQDWRVVDVSKITNQKILGPVTSWQTKKGRYNVEHLAGRGTNNRLLTFYWQPDGKDWRVIDVSAKTRRKIYGPVVSWQTRNGRFNVEHLAGRGANNRLLAFHSQPNGKGWRAVDVSADTGHRIHGTPTVFQRRIGGQNVEVLGAHNPGNQLQMFWWTPSRRWQAANLTAATGFSAHSNVASWVTPGRPGRRRGERFAAMSCDNNLLVTYRLEKVRTLTDKIGAGRASARRVRGVRNVLTILVDPRRPDHPAPDVGLIREMLFGKRPSVRDYFLENSGRKLRLRNVGILGWYRLPKPWSYYWGPKDEGDKDGNGWIKPHEQKKAEAVRMADANFNFKSYDKNRDGILSPNELSILIVEPQNRSSGNQRKLFSRERPATPFVADGVRIPATVEAYVSKREPNHYGVIAHELSHLILGLDDMYPGRDDSGKEFLISVRAGQHSLMDRHGRSTHIDAANKLKLGWLRPELILRSGRYKLRDVESQRDALVLINPQRSVDEYFLITNRARGGSYDKRLADEGIAIWHVIENRDVFGDNSLPPPPNASAADVAWWNKSRSSWWRRGIRMIRPVTTVVNDSKALWTSSEPDPGELRWADGSKSGFSLSRLSPPGREMSFTVRTATRPHKGASPRPCDRQLTRQSKRPIKVRRRRASQ